MSNDKEETHKSGTPDEADQELAELLDSALKDFTKDEQKPTKEPEDTKKEDLTETAWSEEFIRQAAEQFETSMASLLRESVAPNVTPDQVQQSFQQMAAAAAAAVSNTNEGTPDAEFTESITQALRGLTEGSENLQNPFSETDLMNMFGQTDGDQNSFMPFMQGMMQSLLSKDVLYPSLKDIVSKYPAWIEANAGSLPIEERHRFEKQLELMNKVCAQLEKESENASAEQKRTHFDTVLSLMQKMQDYGQPPTELVGDIGPAIPFDMQGNPNLNQCSVM